MKSEFKPPRMRLKPWEVLYIVGGLLLTIVLAAAGWLVYYFGTSLD
jgi:hypothetical protein